MNNPSLNDISDSLIEVIRLKEDHYFSIKNLAKLLNQDNDAIISAIELLRKTGYEIKDDGNNKYAFVSAPDLLLKAEILRELDTLFVGQNINAYKSVQSTNDIASKLARSGAPEGSIVVSEEQTHGRGRFQRNWFSAPEKGIYCSIILYPKIEPSYAPGLSLMTAVSLVDVLSKKNSLDAKIKWPNDCFIGDRKIAGILTELSAEIGRINHIIVGVGINVNHQLSDFPEEINGRSTSLRIELDRSVSRINLLKKFLRSFEKDYLSFRRSGLGELQDRIIKHSNVIGRQIVLEQNNRIIKGLAVDINTEGHLILEMSDGSQESFNAGEVTIKK